MFHSQRYNKPISDSFANEILSELFAAHADWLVERESTGFRLRCPICGDSKQFKHKQRGHIYKTSWNYHCFNCGEHMSLARFIGYFDERLAMKFRLGTLYDTMPQIQGSMLLHRDEKPQCENYEFNEGELISLAEYPPALEYAKSRRIREEVYNDWYYCIKSPKFYRKKTEAEMAAVNKVSANELGGRIVMPYYRFGGKWKQADARALCNAMPRYINIPGMPRELYNIDFVDFTKPFYLMEGLVDSTFVRNSIAFGGTQHFAKLVLKNESIMSHRENAVVIWDNDEPGYKMLGDTAGDMLRWLDWRGIDAKDLNEAILKNIIPLDPAGFIPDEWLKARWMEPAMTNAAIWAKLRIADLRN